MFTIPVLPPSVPLPVEEPVVERAMTDELSEVQLALTLAPFC